MSIFSHWDIMEAGVAVLPIVDGPFTGLAATRHLSAEEAKWECYAQGLFRKNFSKGENVPGFVTGREPFRTSGAMSE